MLWNFPKPALYTVFLRSIYLHNVIIKRAGGERVEFPYGEGANHRIQRPPMGRASIHRSAVKACSDDSGVGRQEDGGGKHSPGSREFLRKLRLIRNLLILIWTGMHTGRPEISYTHPRPD
jgi:hypothetical protein